MKKRLQHRCFLVNIGRFLWATILENLCQGLILIINCYYQISAMFVVSECPATSKLWPKFILKILIFWDFTSQSTSEKFYDIFILAWKNLIRYFFRLIFPLNLFKRLTQSFTNNRQPFSDKMHYFSQIILQEIKDEKVEETDACLWQSTQE